MYLGLFILGLIVGRNLHEIYHRAKADTHKVFQALLQTSAAQIGYTVVEGVYILLMRKLTDRHRQPHDFLHPCRKYVCADCGGRPMSITTYTRRLKALR